MQRLKPLGRLEVQRKPCFAGIEQVELGIDANAQPRILWRADAGNRGTELA